jgi:hypothetical protein
MPRQHAASTPPASRSNEPWVRITVSIPPAWKRWLDEAAAVRGLSVAALVRQCIRGLMVTRHETNGSSNS